MDKQLQLLSNPTAVRGSEDAELVLRQGAKFLERVATKVFGVRRDWATWIHRLGDGG